MGLFDIFKKNHNSKTTADLQHSELFCVLKKLKKSQSPAVMKELSCVLKSYIDGGTWIPMPTKQDAHGYQLRILENQGKAYAAMYSDNSEVKTPGSIVMTDINKLLSPVFENPAIGGIVIDPDTTSLCLDKGFILKCILHGYLSEQNNAGSPQRDWGTGIPNYSKADLMTEGEMLNFAMHTVLDREEAFSKLTPISACDHPEAIPNLIFENNGHFVFVVVKGYCAEEAPSLTLEDKNKLLSYCTRFNAQCYYAPVGFRSATDIERFNACLALKGDGFYAKYEGLEPVGK